MSFLLLVLLFKDGVELNEHFERMYDKTYSKSFQNKGSDWTICWQVTVATITICVSVLGNLYAISLGCRIFYIHIWHLKRLVQILRITVLAVFLDFKSTLCVSNSVVWSVHIK